MNLQNTAGRVNQHCRTTGRSHQLHRFPYDQLQSFLRFQSGMNDIADLMKQV
jgi:hypothetical protein